MKYIQHLDTMAKMLNGILQYLEKATAFSEEKDFDVKIFLNTRLVPDQFSLLQQIQTCCDSAKFAAARVSGKTPPVHVDDETTVSELQSRISQTVDYLKTFNEEDFKNADTIKVMLPFMPDKYLTGNEYFVQFSLPNFYFHMTSAYSILRQNGVNLGKIDYLVSLPMKNVT